MHIGPGKTGTSYLQSVFWSSLDALAVQGLVLPLEKRDHFYAALALRGLLTDEAFPPEAFTALDRLRTAVASVPQNFDVLITQERLASSTPAQVRELLDVVPGWEVHVIITARDLGRQIPSVWQQMIKKGLSIGYDEFLEAVVEDSALAMDFWARQDLAVVAAHWSNAGHPERTHIVTIPPPSGSPRDLLLQRFCSVVEADPSRLDTTAAVSNSSLGHPQAELLRRANIALREARGEALDDPSTPEVKKAATYLAKEVLATQDGRPAEIPPQLQEWCLRTSAQTIADLGSQGYHVVGDLAELMPSFDPHAPSAAQMNDADVATAAAQALATVAAQRRDDVNQRRRMSARPDKRKNRRREFPSCFTASNPEP